MSNHSIPPPQVAAISHLSHHHPPHFEPVPVSAAVAPASSSSHLNDRNQQPQDGRRSNPDSGFSDSNHSDPDSPYKSDPRAEFNNLKAVKSEPGGLNGFNESQVPEAVHMSIPGEIYILL